MPGSTFQSSVTTLPLTVVVKVVGAAGTAVQPTVTTRSLVGALAPMAFTASTRT